MPRGMKAKGNLERFHTSYEENESGCWVWQKHLNASGYGSFAFYQGYYSSKVVLAHRYAYTVIGGKEIPAGLEIDHLCRNRACVNPAHLEAVTHHENVHRGDLAKVAGATNRNKTHCKEGHEFSAANTMTTKRGARVCRSCKSIWAKKYYNAVKVVS